jgi:putative hydrolases of HD superfamily
MADIEEQNGAAIDWKKLYEITSSHDYGEIFIGDIKTPVKHYSLDFRGMLQQGGMIAHFIEENIPEESKPIFYRQLREGKDESVEGLIA